MKKQSQRKSFSSETNWKAERNLITAPVEEQAVM